MLDLNDLRCFVQLVDAKGITSASRQLRIPKSTLSKRLAALEEALSVRLVQRTSRRFVVTELGLEFYERAKAAVVEAEAAEAVVRGRLAEPSGTVRVTASVPTAQHRLATFLPELAREYPRIRIELHATDRFVDLVREGFDIGFPRGHDLVSPRRARGKRGSGTPLPDGCRRIFSALERSVRRTRCRLLTSGSLSQRAQRRPCCADPAGVDGGRRVHHVVDAPPSRPFTFRARRGGRLDRTTQRR
ncbi:MAG TPA: LysR family transcriptional regulator [Polyangiaceae bacterium]